MFPTWTCCPSSLGCQGEFLAPETAADALAADQGVSSKWDLSVTSCGGQQVEPDGPQIVQELSCISSGQRKSSQCECPCVGPLGIWVFPEGPVCA